MIGTIMLWSLGIALSASGSGVSMPQNTVMKNASRIISRISGRLAMFSVASQASRISKPVRFCHSTRCGSRSSAALRLPMKLSSTK